MLYPEAWEEYADTNIPNKCKECGWWYYDDRKPVNSFCRLRTCLFP